MVDITEISAMVAAAGVLVGVVFAVLQLKDFVKTRQNRPRDETILNFWKSRSFRMLGQE